MINLMVQAAPDGGRIPARRRRHAPWSPRGASSALATQLLGPCVKTGVAQGPPTPQLSPVTVRVGDTVEWKVEAIQHGLLFTTESDAKAILNFAPGVGETLQDNSACFPGQFTWGTDSGCNGFPAGTFLARATVKATGSLRFTCELHGPQRMMVMLNASP
jgi:plastocyanin